MTNKFKSLKYLGIALILWALFLSYKNYKVVEGLLLDRYDGYQATIETSISSNLNKYQDISRMLNSLIDVRLENCTNELQNLYQNDSDVTNWDLQNIRKKYANLHIYIIDSDLVVINTTDKKDLGLDFKKFKVLSQILYKRLNENVLIIDDMDLSIKSSKLNKYSYMPTPDNKYIIELSIDIEKELASDIPLSKVGSEIVRDIDFVDNVNIYKLDKDKKPFRKINRNKREKFIFDKILIDYATKAVNENKTTEYIEINADSDELVHRFIPLNVYDNNENYDWWKSYLIEVQYNNKALNLALSTEKKRTVEMMMLIICVYGALMIAIHLLVIKSIKDKRNIEKIIETTNEGFCRVDRGFDIVSVNNSLCKILSYDAEEILNKNVRDFLPVDRLLNTDDIVSGNETKQFTLEEAIVDKHGREIYVRIQATVLYENEFDGLFAFIHDITEEKNAENYIKHLAYHDALTNLPNRKYMEKKVEQIYDLASESKDSFAIMFIDLDDFKSINDNYGHDVGDELLRKVADRFISILDDDDVIARIGGDEFVLLTSNENVVDTAKSIYTGFSKSFKIHGNDIYAKLSIGIALYPDDGSTVEELIKNADDAMYVSKRNGKNNFILYKDIKSYTK